MFDDIAKLKTVKIVQFPKKYVAKQHLKGENGVSVRVHIGKIGGHRDRDEIKIDRAAFIGSEYTWVFSDEVYLVWTPLFAEYKVTQVRAKEYSGYDDGRVFYEALVNGIWKPFYKKDQTAKTKKLLPVASQLKWLGWRLDEVTAYLREYCTNVSQVFYL